MAHILILGGGAAGLAAALAAAQAAPAARVTVLERNPKVGKKLLATGNGRCNLDNTAIAPEKYFTADPAALRPLLAAVDAAAPLAWFGQLGLYTRTDEAGRVYPYSNQAADVLALLELHLQRHKVQLRTGCTVSTLRQSKGGYAVQFANPEGDMESLRADAVICAMGGAAGPQFGTDGFGTRFAAACGGQMRPLYPCLTALQCANPNKSLAGIRAKAAARLLDGDRMLAEEMGEVQFTDYGLSGICIMQLSGLLAPGRSPKHPAVELDLFPAVPETELAALFAARAPLLAEDTAAAFWLGLLHGKLGRALWAAAALPDTARRQLAEACPRRQALAVRGAYPLRLAAGADHRRRACSDRGRVHLPVQGLSGAVLRGGNVGLRRKLRRLQPALGVRQRPCRRAGRRKAPLQPKTVTKKGLLKRQLALQEPFLFLLALGKQLCTLQCGAQCQIQHHGAGSGSHTVHKGDAAGDLGQRLCHGVLLPKDVHVAEVAKEGVGEHVQQQTGTRRDDHLDQIPGAVTILIPQLEHLMCHGTAGDADDKLEHEGGNGVARVTGKDIRQRQTDGTRQTAGYTVQQQRRQGGKGVAQMERGAAVERDAEEQVGH